MLELPPVALRVSQAAPSVVDAAAWKGTLAELLVWTVMFCVEVAEPPATALKNSPAGTGFGSGSPLLA